MQTTNSGKFFIAPADDLRDEYAAGYDGNFFATEDEAQAAIPSLIDAIGGEWVVSERD